MIFLHNTLTGKREKFKPIRGKRVGFYTCGPTAYDYAHIGNLRTYIFEDILKRTLLLNNFSVRHVMNITDVDDKTIKKSLEENKPLKVLTSRYAKAFKEDLKKLNIVRPDKFAPATLYIKEIISAIKKLIEKKFAYQKGSSVYFRIKKFSGYGQLSRIRQRDLKTGATVDVDEYDKDNPADFVLWKARTEKDGNNFWKSPWGNGRPGWHIECSVIAAKELGQPFDIHAGGVDLIFPHHENEIARAEAVSGKRFVNYWLHGEHLLVDGQKMAKSLNNFLTLRDLEERGFSSLVYRYFVMQAHYRSKLNFTWQALSAAQNALKKIWVAARDLPVPRGKCGELEKRFGAAIDDDLNMPEALAVLWELLKSNYPKQAVAASLLRFDKVLGLDISRYLSRKLKLPKRVSDILKKRDKARRANDWTTADNLRKKLARMGYEVEDTPEGCRVVKSTFAT